MFGRCYRQKLKNKFQTCANHCQDAHLLWLELHHEVSRQSLSIEIFLSCCLTVLINMDNANDDDSSNSHIEFQIHCHGTIGYIKVSHGILFHQSDIGWFRNQIISFLRRFRRIRRLLSENDGKVSIYDYNDRDIEIETIDDLEEQIVASDTNKPIKLLISTAAPSENNNSDNVETINVENNTAIATTVDIDIANNHDDNSDINIQTIKATDETDHDHDGDIKNDELVIVSDASILVDNINESQDETCESKNQNQSDAHNQFQSQFGNINIEAGNLFNVNNNIDLIDSGNLNSNRVTDALNLSNVGQIQLAPEQAQFVQNQCQFDDYRYLVKYGVPSDSLIHVPFFYPDCQCDNKNKNNNNNKSNNQKVEQKQENMQSGRSIFDYLSTSATNHVTGKKMNNQESKSTRTDKNIDKNNSECRSRSIFNAEDIKTDNINNDHDAGKVSSKKMTLKSDINNGKDREKTKDETCDDNSDKQKIVDKMLNNNFEKRNYKYENKKSVKKKKMSQVERKQVEFNNEIKKKKKNTNSKKNENKREVKRTNHNMVDVDADGPSLRNDRRRKTRARTKEIEKPIQTTDNNKTNSHQERQDKTRMRRHEFNHDNPRNKKKQIVTINATNRDINNNLSYDEMKQKEEIQFKIEGNLKMDNDIENKPNIDASITDNICNSRSRAPNHVFSNAKNDYPSQEQFKGIETNIHYGSKRRLRRLVTTYSEDSSWKSSSWSRSNSSSSVEFGNNIYRHNRKSNYVQSEKGDEKYGDDHNKENRLKLIESHSWSNINLNSNSNQTTGGGYRRRSISNSTHNQCSNIGNNTNMTSELEFKERYVKENINTNDNYSGSGNYNVNNNQRNDDYDLDHKNDENFNLKPNFIKEKSNNTCINESRTDRRKSRARDRYRYDHDNDIRNVVNEKNGVAHNDDCEDVHNQGNSKLNTNINQSSQISHANFDNNYDHNYNHNDRDERNNVNVSCDTKLQGDSQTAHVQQVEKELMNQEQDSKHNDYNNQIIDHVNDGQMHGNMQHGVKMTKKDIEAIPQQIKIQNDVRNVFGKGKNDLSNKNKENNDITGDIVNKWQSIGIDKRILDMLSGS